MRRTRNYKRIVIKNKNPIPYDGDISIVKIFSELIKNNWVPIKEGKNILGLVKDKKNITLEPGLQFELSGDAVENIHQIEVIKELKTKINLLEDKLTQKEFERNFNDELANN